MIKRTYQAIMDPRRNPLRHLPRTVCFQYMCILAYMWSAIFAIALGSALAFGVSLVGHVAVLVGIFLTAEVFRSARRQSLHHRELYSDPNQPGVRYDDIWGG